MKAFVNNKYQNLYFAIIDAAKYRINNDGYVERHHIIPRSMGGSNRSENIVVLTYREHFLVHWLLTKFTEGEDLRKMRFAVVQMCRAQGKKIIAGWQYELSKRYHSLAAKGRKYKLRKPRSEEFRRKMSQSKKGTKMSPHQVIWMRENFAGEGNPYFGKKHSEETRAKMSKARKARGPISEDTRRKMSESHTQYQKFLGRCPRENKFKPGEWRGGWKHSDEIRLKMSIAQQKIPKKECPHCNRLFCPGMYAKYHGNKCKMLTTVVCRVASRKRERLVLLENRL